jgi:positive regulator of sigma E activity
MNKLWKILQYGYLAVAIIFFIEGFLALNSDKEKSFIMFGFGIFITLVFFFKRHFRKKVEKRNSQAQ